MRTGSLSAAVLASSSIIITLPSCASMIDGTSQSILVSTNPAGASCGFYREGGVQIGMIQSTPGQVVVRKSKADIWIVCVKPGYQEGLFYDHSGVAGSAFVNIVGGIFTLGISTAIGVAVDSSNGSDNKYDTPVNFTMVPNEPGKPEGPSVLPQVFNAAKPVSPSSQQMTVTPEPAPATSVPATSAPATSVPTPLAPASPAPSASTVPSSPPPPQSAPAATTPATPPAGNDAAPASPAPSADQYQSRFRL